MKQAATISFRDLGSSEEALVIVRYDAEQVSLCLSLKNDGDLEVFMDKGSATKLIDALTKAVA